MAKLSCLEIDVTDKGVAYLKGIAEEKNRCAEIALNIWKKKPAKDAEWYKTVGLEIAAEIMGIREKLINIAGFSEEEAATTAIKLTQIAADVASFLNTDIHNQFMTLEYMEELRKITLNDYKRMYEGNWEE